MKVVKDSFEKCQFYNVQFSNKEMSGAKDHGGGGGGALLECTLNTGRNALRAVCHIEM